MVVIAEDAEISVEPPIKAGIARVLAFKTTASTKRFSFAKKPLSWAT